MLQVERGIPRKNSWCMWTIVDKKYSKRIGDWICRTYGFHCDNKIGIGIMKDLMLIQHNRAKARWIWLYNFLFWQIRISTSECAHCLRKGVSLCNQEVGHDKFLCSNLRESVSMSTIYPCLTEQPHYKRLYRWLVEQENED